jgi:chromosome segregation ATPase
VSGHYANLDRAFAAAKDETEGLREQLAAAQSEANDLHTKIRELGASNQALGAEVEDWHDKHARARQRSADLQSELTTAEAALAAARQRILAIESSRTWRWTRPLRRGGS